MVRVVRNVLFAESSFYNANVEQPLGHFQVPSIPYFILDLYKVDEPRLMDPRVDAALDIHFAAIYLLVLFQPQPSQLLVAA